MPPETLRVLLTDILDYAGLFPPAQLELDPAIRNYARYRTEAEAWMLGRFICPAPRLCELVPYGDTLLAEPPAFRFSVLCRGGESPTALLARLEDDGADVAAFDAALGARAAVAAFEIKLPPALLDADELRLAEFLRAARDRFDSVGLAGRPVFWEPPLPPRADWTRPANLLAHALAAYNADRPAGPGRFGFKLRTGGVEASAFPTCEQVARVIEACAHAGTPMKFTAGLHHPIRRYDPGVRAHMHGFINVFAAAILGRELRLELFDLVAILDELDPANFTLGDEFFGWNQAEVTLGELEHGRQHVALSFGSCSFDEPREDLRALRWL